MALEYIGNLFIGVQAGRVLILLLLVISRMEFLWAKSLHIIVLSQ